jgi:nicotinamide-nucleotide amidase
VRHSRAQVGVAVTGIAGPGGGSPGKPVGTVWFAFMAGGKLSSEMRRFDGDRAAVRRQTVEHALQRLIERIEETEP